MKFIDYIPPEEPSIVIDGRLVPMKNAEAVDYLAKQAMDLSRYSPLESQTGAKRVEEG